jgi:hypothetical protein
MKVVNLDQIVTNKERAIILGGVEHVMHTPTVEDYIEQMKRAEKIEKLGGESELDTASKMLELTIETLLKSFPTVTEEQFRKLTMAQLSAIRMLAEDASSEDAGEGEAQGETG